MPSWQQDGEEYPGQWAGRARCEHGLLEHCRAPFCGKRTPVRALAVLQEVRTSNMVTFRKCERKAFFEVVLGERREEGEQFDFGTCAHKIIEVWLKHGYVPPSTVDQARLFIRDALSDKHDKDFAEKFGKADVERAARLTIPLVLEAGSVVRKGIHLLPTPGAGLVIEEPFAVEVAIGSKAVDFDDPDRVEVVRFKSHGIDLQNHRPVGKDGIVPIRLLDHKTCKTPRFVPTPEKMKDDVQAISYGRQMMVHPSWKWGDVLHCRWIYYPRSNDAAIAVDFHFTRAELEAKWARIVGDVAKLAAYAEGHAQDAVDWRDVPPNYNECDSYGGCQFRNRCAAAQFKTAKKESGMGLMDRARAGEVVGASVSAPIPKATSGAGASLFGAAKVGPKLPTTLKPAPPTPPQAPPPPNTVQTALADAGIESPDEPADNEGDEEVVTATAGLTDDPDHVLESGETIAQALEEGGILPADAAPADPTPPEPKKRGRGKAKAEAAKPPTEPTSVEELVKEAEKELETSRRGDAIRFTVETLKKVGALDNHRGAIVANLRAHAEKAGEKEGLAAANALFVAANMIERGEL